MAMLTDIISSHAYYQSLVSSFTVYKHMKSSDYIVVSLVNDAKVPFGSSVMRLFSRSLERSDILVISWLRYRKQIWRCAVNDPVKPTRCTWHEPYMHQHQVSHGVTRDIRSIIKDTPLTLRVTQCVCCDRPASNHSIDHNSDSVHHKLASIITNRTRMVLAWPKLSTMSCMVQAMIHRTKDLIRNRYLSNVIIRQHIRGQTTRPDEPFSTTRNEWCRVATAGKQAGHKTDRKQVE